MADTAHRLTDEKLEEMEKRLSAIYSRAGKTVQKKMADYAKSIDEKSAELLQVLQPKRKDLPVQQEHGESRIPRSRRPGWDLCGVGGQYGLTA